MISLSTIEHQYKRSNIKYNYLTDMKKDNLIIKDILSQNNQDDLFNTIFDEMNLESFKNYNPQLKKILLKLYFFYLIKNSFDIQSNNLFIKVTSDSTNKIYIRKFRKLFINNIELFKEVVEIPSILSKNYKNAEEIKSLLSSSSESQHVSDYIYENSIFQLIQFILKKNNNSLSISKLLNQIQKNKNTEENKYNNSIQNDDFLFNILTFLSEPNNISNISGNLDSKVNGDIIHNGIIIELKKDFSCLDSELEKKFLLTKINQLNYFFHTYYHPSILQLINNDINQSQDNIRKLHYVINKIIRYFNYNFRENTIQYFYNKTAQDIINSNMHYISYKEKNLFYIGNYFTVGLYSKKFKFKAYKYSFNFNEQLQIPKTISIYSYLEKLFSLGYILDDETIIYHKDNAGNSGGVTNSNSLKNATNQSQGDAQSQGDLQSQGNTQSQSASQSKGENKSFGGIKI